MKLKRDIVEALRNEGLPNINERSEMLARDLDELSGLTLGQRERFLVMRIEGVLCERVLPGPDKSEGKDED